jgi:ligand-binding sensor domain-containing protein
MRLPVNFLGKVLLILFCSLKASSQPRGSVLHYSTEDGLPDNGVMCITKDHKDFIWFGTWAGITRFDGHNFVTLPLTIRRIKNRTTIIGEQADGKK